MAWDKNLVKSKIKATAIHFSVSFLVFVILAYLVIFVWYPEPFFWSDGGWQGIRIIAVVDLILGPFITFLIFNWAKSRREILFDFLVIGIIQIGALIYGVVITYDQRPVAIILIDDFVVSSVEQAYSGQLDSLDELKQYSSETPPVIFADFPMTAEALEEINRIKIDRKILEHEQVHLYQPQGRLKDGLKKRQLRFYERLDIFKKRGAFDSWLEKNEMMNDKVLIAPFNGRYKWIWLVFNLEGKYIGHF